MRIGEPFVTRVAYTQTPNPHRIVAIRLLRAAVRDKITTAADTILILVTGGAGFIYADFSSGITRQGALAFTEICGMPIDLLTGRRI